MKNSVAQIACFLFPVLVLVSLAFSEHLTFVIEPVYLGALALTAIALWQITGDGKASFTRASRSSASTSCSPRSSGSSEPAGAGSAQVSFPSRAREADEAAQPRDLGRRQVAQLARPERPVSVRPA